MEGDESVGAAPQSDAVSGARAVHEAEVRDTSWAEALAGRYVLGRELGGGACPVSHGVLWSRRSQRSVLPWRRGETRGPQLGQRLVLHRHLGDVPQERVKLVVREIRAHATEPGRGVPHDLAHARGTSGVRIQRRLEFHATIGHWRMQDDSGNAPPRDRAA